MNNREAARRSESNPRFLEILTILRKNGLQKGFSPEKLRKTLEDLGPTFIKVGQILSMRKDMLPKEYCQELTRLRSDVVPMRFADVCAVIETSCGSPVTSLFSSFDEVPLGSASIAQVHLATLPEGGRVVVKAQRIGIYEMMAQDIALLRRASGIVKLAGRIGDVINFDALLDEFWTIAQEEMNFLKEAENVEEFCEQNKAIVYVSCPQIYQKLTTDKVLVMEYVDGFRITDKEALLENGYDLSEIGLKLVTNYVKQVAEDGFFQADPHPANLMIRDGKIVWIDLGMMGRLSARDRNLIEKAISAVSMHDYVGVKDVVLKLGQVRGKVDHARLYADIESIVTQYGEAEIGDLDLTTILEDVLEVAKRHEIAMPRGISMLARGVATIEGVIADLCPEISFLELMIHYHSGTVFSKIDWKKELLQSSHAAVDSGKKALEIPSLVSDMLKTTIKGRTKMNLEISGLRDLTKAANNLVNKLILGIIIAALILGSSLVSLSDAYPRVLSVPLPAVFGFTLALLLSLGLIIQNRRNRF